MGLLDRMKARSQEACLAPNNAQASLMDGLQTVVISFPTPQQSAREELKAAKRAIFEKKLPPLRKHKRRGKKSKMSAIDRIRQKLRKYQRNNPGSKHFPAPSIPKRHIQAYAVYIRSDAWNERRRACRNRDHHTCQSCGKTDVQLDVHHKTYQRLFHESLDDLVCLCVPCHDFIHSIAKYRRAKKAQKLATQPNPPATALAGYSP